jgi:diguanylate cyclase (GGDEF)-like protein
VAGFAVEFPGMTILGRSMAAVRRDRMPSTRSAAGAVWHTAAAEELATAGRWEQAHQHLRTAVCLLDGKCGMDVPDRRRREHAVAREQSRRASPTATYNRRYLDERLVALLGDPGVGAAGIAVALLEVDHFEQIHDTHGPAFGDRVLRRLVAVLDAGLPYGAFCVRYGGAEFAIVLPGQDRHNAVRVCEAARERVDRHPWHELAPGLRVIVSVGVAHASRPLTGRDGLVDAADRLLYAAKDAGRNVVAFHDARTGMVRLTGPVTRRRSIA